jgi:HEAT repeat protein
MMGNQMAEYEDFTELLEKLDGSGSDNEFNAVHELRKLGDEFPKLLLEKYRSSKKWRVRSSCVYHAIRYSRTVSDAVKLGVEALSDKSHAVRYRACMLLAYSLDQNALPNLKEARGKTTHQETSQDIRATIDAIENQNSNYFVDRDHSGKMTLKVN